MTNPSDQKPMGYGHDKKGAAGGENTGDGKPHVDHSAPVDKVAGVGQAGDAITFVLDGKEVQASADETIWQVAQRCGTTIPHLCYSPEPGYRADGNCRACVVEIEGERVLAASCIRKPTAGMKVKTQSERATAGRNMVLELLVTDQPKREVAHDPASKFWNWAAKMDVSVSRFPEREKIGADRSHPAMAVNLDACIQCNLCVRACREVQVNDVIGMAGRGHNEKIVFDFDDPMGSSTCVACGECVQACPTGALMPSTLVDENNIRTEAYFPDREVDSVCPYCGVGCQLTYNVKDDKLLYVTGKAGPANESRLCVKGRFGFDYVSNPQRLTQPLVRKDGVPKRADDLVDPANPWTHFRVATWEEAMERAAAGLVKVRDRDGPRALAGFGSAKGSNEEAYLFQKLVRTGFGSNNVDHCTRLCHASSVAALLEGVGSAAVTATFNECKNSDVIVVIGANPTENHPVAATFFKQAAKRGTKLIIMDPRGTAMKRHAWKMMQFKNGTDVAMLNGLLNVIITEKLYDQQYVQTYTEDFEKLAESVKPFTPEEMSPICGIEPDVLREVARTFARAESAIIFWGMGVSQHTHGTDNARCLIALSLICGQVGRPGTGLHPLRGQNNVQGASDAGLIPMFFPDYKSVENSEIRAKYEAAWGVTLDPKRGKTVVEIMDAIHADEIKGMYIMGENPAMSDPDLNHARGALAHLEHLVVQDIFLTETASYADVILPASAWPEKNGTVTNTNRQVQMGRAAIPLPGEARQDLWIIQDLAQRIGCDWNYTDVSQVFTEMSSLMPALANISWDRVAREDHVTYPVDGPDVSGRDVVFDKGFPREGGVAKLVATRYTAPDEVPDAEYPFILSTGRQLEHWHTGSMTRRATVLDALEPTAIAQLSRGTISKLGIQPGDMVRVSTRRGTVSLAARQDDAVPDGVVFIPFAYVEAAANLLTNPALDPFGKIPEFKFCAAKVERDEPIHEAAE
ncbi:putative formate dehydrogenase [Variibacter gotjawalensis]|uniref:Putative formate dehydrogenase n=1 Tax=Variibacter gotjawalensis TaxID=1333996 RepID=A0A0S3PWT8_9BRAD|nr:formate dehydrogenase subunit alpha [Variibacter gotjawalensis]NIK46233.1 formate dehydrogenase major subunit [Variibacter gotjawalensis]RZS48149.1 NAD-dependent formate dehydrogenase catalytic subunit /NAD-dependent formate dehydrogenase iron-sulfur protein [Variibacter gotjawalensis]BAT60406.1 putative formate dehydrogenase [Variibacter gotjawalensis]